MDARETCVGACVVAAAHAAVVDTCACEWYLAVTAWWCLLEADATHAHVCIVALVERCDHQAHVAAAGVYL